MQAFNMEGNSILLPAPQNSRFGMKLQFSLKGVVASAENCFGVLPNR